MDCIKTGRLIKNLRQEKRLTQKQLADSIGVSDKTVSKWERGYGCPDVSLLGTLCAALGITVHSLLCGELSCNDNGGNMKKTVFYVCPNCGNILISTGESEPACCGRRLHPLHAKPADDEHMPAVSEIEDEHYITFPHEMTKSHYIAFAAYVSYDRVLLVRLYPEQGGELRIPRMHGGKLYLYCSQHGLWVSDPDLS